MAQTFPTKANLLSSKKSLELAKTGYDLMDRKRNILMREMMKLIEKTGELEKELDKCYSEAYESLKLANINGGSVRRFAMTVPNEEGLTLSENSIMGVEIPVIDCPQRVADPRFFGLGSTSEYLDEACVRFCRARQLTLELAEIETGVCRLADAVSKTRKRSNALSNIIIPRLENTVKHITEVLDEKEREDFSRLKVTKSFTDSKK